jgi:acyl-CoA synthetase (AMP-forming)/AMP-acid ligase II
MAERPTPPLVGDFATLGAALDAAGEQHGDREAYVDGERRLTFAAWARASAGLAATLAERGVGKGNVVALMLPSGIDYAISYAAVVRLGAVVTGLNTRLGPREVGAILERAAPALVIFDPSAGFPDVPTGFAVLERAELRAAYAAAPPATTPAVTASDPAVIIWTSGTTGAPKGAWFDHRNLFAAVASAGAMSAPYDRRLVATPFAHAGYMAKLWDQIAWGFTMVVSPVPWSAAQMVDVMRREQITVAGGVPTQWAKLVDEPTLVPGSMPHLRIGTAATAPAPPELVERVGEVLGVPLVVRYAMTESPSICGTEPDDSPLVQFQTVGRPQTGIEVRIVGDGDGDGDVPLGTDEVGRVQVRGGCVMRGYWRDPEKTAEVMVGDGWMRTGDLGRLRADGNLVLVGRASDMYIRGGYNVYPLEVENVLAEHPAVSRVAIVGKPTAVIGEIGVAFVVPTDPAEPPALDELRTWTRDRLADYKAPDQLEVVTELPLTEMLKVDKAALRRTLA